MDELMIQCSCGDVKLRLVGAPIVCVYCHCDDCQRAHGGAYLPAAIYPADRVLVVSGDPLPWKRTTTVRATCRACGTRLFAEPSGLGVRSVTAYLLPDGLFQPAFHMQCQHALLPVRDALPHYRHYPAALGGSDEQMPW